MSEFIFEHSSGLNWKAISEKFLGKIPIGTLKPDQSYLGIVYFTDHLTNDAETIVNFFRNLTGVQEWIGSVGIGICATGTEYFDTPAVAMMILELPKDSIHIINNEQSSALKLNSSSNEMLSGISNFGILHIDPRNRDIDGSLKTLAANLNCFFVGGLSSSRNQNLQIAGGVETGEITGAVISDSVSVMTALTQSCIPFSTERSITDYKDNVILKLDGRPALEILKEVIEAQNRTDTPLQPEQILVALPVLNSDTEDYIVRNLIGIEVQNKSLAINEMIEPGSTLKFCRRDSEAAELDLLETIRKLKKRIPKTPKGGVYFSCLARGPNMFDRSRSELKLIESELGNLPIIGLFCSGEISNQRLYTYTGVLALFI